MYNRRQLLTRLGATAATGIGVGILPRWARAQVANDQVVLAVFLRGAADAASIVFPTPGSSPARQKYEAWRSATGTRITTTTMALGHGLSLHPPSGRSVRRSTRATSASSRAWPTRS